MILGELSRELQVRLPRPLHPDATNLADRASWSLAGSAAELARRLAALNVAAGVIARIGNDHEDKQLLAELRRHGVDTSSVERDPGLRTNLSVLILEPGHRSRLQDQALPPAPRIEKFRGRLRGVRHLHVCGSILSNPSWTRLAVEAVRKTRSDGASSSVDLSSLKPTAVDKQALELTALCRFVLASSASLRWVSGEPRLSLAAEQLQAKGVETVVAMLGAGGYRVYHGQDAVRVPPLGRDRDPEESAAFVSGYLLGWLLGGEPTRAALIGSAARTAARRGEDTDRPALCRSLQLARRNPQLRKLVGAMREAEELLGQRRRLPRRKRTS